MAPEQLAGRPPLLIIPDDTGRLRVVSGTLLPETKISWTESTGVLSAQTWVTHRRSGPLFHPEARELEELINTPGVPERELQHFFERYPALLKLTDYDHVQAHPVLLRSDGSELIPDFMLHPEGGFGDVLDLKRPGAKLVAGKHNRLRPTAHLAEAIAQVREYRAYFDDEAHRATYERAYGLRAYKPRAIVVIGRDVDNDPLELRRLWLDAPPDTEIQTYDQLLRRIRRLGRL